MAKTVYDSEVINLQDERTVTLKPLAIGRLRRFMKAWGEFANIETEEQAFDIYINCCGISLEKEVTDKFPSLKDTQDAEKVITDEYREYLEDVLDMDTIYKILDVCGGLKLNDPKLLEAAEKLVQERVGTN